MPDEPIVNVDEVSEETPLPEVETPQPQPLTAEQESRVAQLVTEQLEAAKETGRREMQGKKDREVADAQRRTRYAEDSLGRVRGRYSELEPEARQTLENEDLRGELNFYRTRDAQEAQERQAITFTQTLNASLLAHLEDLGIDPHDKRIDWANDATDFVQGQSRFNKSVAKIVKEDKSKVHREADEKLAKERKEQGLDSVDTSVPVAVSKGIPTDLTKFREWISGLPQGEYEKLKPDIDKMMAENKIK